MDVKTRLQEITRSRYGQGLSLCSDRQLYCALLQYTQELSQGRPAPVGERKLYYFSAEFLIGKLLSNNLLAFGIYDEVKRALEEAGPAVRNYARQYFRLTRQEGWSWGVMRGAWSSVADLAVAQMQDLLSEGAKGRINVPSTLGGNWQWRMLPGKADGRLARRLLQYTTLYNRGPVKKEQ